MPITDKGVLVLDIGTSMLKACLIDQKGDFLASDRCVWSCQPEENVPGGLTFVPEDLLQRVFSLARGVIADHPDVRTEGIIVSTQRLGFVLLDQNGHSLAGLSNIDRRAVEEARRIENSDNAFSILGRWSGPQHLHARLMWYRRHRPDIMDSCAHILSIGGYVSYALCGRMGWDGTTACETALLDIRHLRWDEKALAALGLSSGMFGCFQENGAKMGELTEAAASALGLPAGIPVFMGGGDTQLGVLGAGGIHQGDMVIVAGSSAPVNAVIQHPITDAEMRMITNPHAVPGLSVMEANAMMTGISFQWARDLLWDRAERSYAKLNDLARDTWQTKPPMHLTVFAGASLAHAQKGNSYPLGSIQFSMRDVNAQADFREGLALGVFEAAAYAILGNVRMLSQRAGKPERLVIGGGETRLPFLLELLSALSPAPLYVSQGEDLTCLGAAILAWTDLGEYASLQQAAAVMARVSEAPLDQLNHQDALRQRMEKWIQGMEAWRNLQQEAKK